MTDPAISAEATPPVKRSPWRVYTGDPTVEPAPIAVPDAPSWRRFDDDAEPVAEDLAMEDADAGATFRATPEMIDAVNAALHLRRPLLLTGRPGSGKSSLIDAVARELMLGRVLRWHVTSGSTMTDALYRYDAIGRLHAQSLREASSRVRGRVPSRRSPASAIRPAIAGLRPAIAGRLRSSRGTCGSGRWVPRCCRPGARARCSSTRSTRATSTCRTTCSTCSSAASTQSPSWPGSTARR